MTIFNELFGDSSSEEKKRRFQEEAEFELESELTILVNQAKIRSREKQLAFKESELYQLCELAMEELGRARGLISRGRYEQAKDALRLRGLLPAEIKAEFYELRPVRELFQRLYREQGFDLLDGGQFFNAVDALANARSQGHLDDGGLFALARAFYMTGLLEQAAEAIDSAIKAFTKFPYYYVEKARIWLDVARLSAQDCNQYIVNDEVEKVKEAGRVRLKEAQDNTLEALGGAYHYAPDDFAIWHQCQRIYDELEPTGKYIPLDLTPLHRQGVYPDRRRLTA